MRIRKAKFSILFLLLLVIRLIPSCTPETCIGETTSFVHVTFYKATTNKLTAPDSITVFGIGLDTARLYSKALNTSSIKLPLDASSDRCGFMLKINNKTDSLKFVYTSYPHLISKECGITFFYSLNSLQAGGSAIDTVLIFNKNITTFNGENIRIIYH
jgi:hypothetical protein